jgi:hypothetical protein
VTNKTHLSNLRNFVNKNLNIVLKNNIASGVSAPIPFLFVREETLPLLQERLTPLPVCMAVYQRRDRGLRLRGGIKVEIRKIAVLGAVVVSVLHEDWP